MRKTNSGHALAVAFGLLLTVAVGHAQRVIGVSYLHSRCDYCSMLFQDRRFGGELETTSDSTLDFDATECMAAFLLGKTIPDSLIKNLWSVDYAWPTSLIDARTAVYVHSPNIESPMSVGLAAFGNVMDADGAIRKFGGEILTWGEVKALVDNRWFHPSPRKHK
jgi:copper chaperone NosL